MTTTAEFLNEVQSFEDVEKFYNAGCYKSITECINYLLEAARQVYGVSSVQH